MTALAGQLSGIQRFFAALKGFNVLVLQCKEVSPGSSTRRSCARYKLCAYGQSAVSSTAARRIHVATVDAVHLGCVFESKDNPCTSSLCVARSFSTVLRMTPLGRSCA